MKKISWPTVIVILILAIGSVTVLWVCNNKGSETITIYCGPGQTNPRVVFKRPTEAFPVFIKEKDLRLKVSLLDSMANRGASLGLGYRDSIVELREKLSEKAAMEENILKGLFYAFNQNPCDSITSRQYFDLIAKISEQNGALEAFKAQVTYSQEKGGVEGGDFIIISDTIKFKDALGKLKSQIITNESQ